MAQITWTQNSEQISLVAATPQHPICKKTSCKALLFTVKSERFEHRGNTHGYFPFEHIYMQVLSAGASGLNQKRHHNTCQTPKFITLVRLKNKLSLEIISEPRLNQWEINQSIHWLFVRTVRTRLAGEVL